MKKRIFVMFIALILVFAASFEASAQSIRDLRNQQQKIADELKKNEQAMKEMNAQKNEVGDQIKELDLRVSNAAAELEAVETQIQIIELNIVQTLEELQQAELNIKEKQEAFNQRLRVMYKNGNAGYLELLVSSGNIRDFLSRQEMVQSIADYDKELIKYMREQRDIIEDNKISLETHRTSLEISKQKAEDRKRDLERTTREKEVLMSNIVKDIKAFEKEYDKLNAYAKEIEKKIVALQSNTGPYSGGRMSWPVPGYNRISSYYGYRIHPIFKVKKLHTGIDIPAPTGRNVVVAADGKVIFTDWLGGYGKAVMVDHNGGIVTLYAHNSSIIVSEGQLVKRGQTIARIGSTGNSTGPHSHFEVRKNGAYVDPIPWLKGN